MASYYSDGNTFTVVYRLKGQPRDYVYGIKTEKLAKAACAKKSNEEQLVRAGLHTPDAKADKYAKHAAAPITEHVDAFERSLKAKGRDAQHVSQTVAHVRRLLKMARVKRIPDLEADPIQEAASRLMAEQELSPRTANAALKSLRQFSTWLMKSERTRYDLLHKRLETFNEDVDIRRKRRAMEADEISWLIETTEQAKDFTSRRCGVPPLDRAMLYLAGLGTGYRQGALLTLTPESFHVAESLLRPFIRLAARDNKKRKDRDQPIRRDLAMKLRGWLKGRPAGVRVWRPSPHADLSLRFRRDMEGARKAWIEAGSTPAEQKRREEHPTFLRYSYHDGVRNIFADFHGLRHTGITLVVRSAGLRVGQAWADHSTPVLTARYAHLDLPDEDKALEALPEVATKRTAAKTKRIG